MERKYEKKTAFSVIILLGVIAALAIIPSFFEFPSDGLEKVGEENDLPEGTAFGLGIADDYDFFGLGPIVGTLLAAILCFILVGGLFLLWTHISRRRSQQS